MIRSVVVLGTGVMAPGIAQACASAGASVIITGRSRNQAEVAARKSCPDVGVGPISRQSFVGCDLVIETVLEDVSVKRDLLQRIESWVRSDTIITTNTSSFPVQTLATALKSRQRFAGMHFLYPAAATAVVEIIPGPDSSRATTDSLVEFVAQMKKRPIVLQRDYPGFVWNRLQMALLRECLHLLDEGVADIESIDAAVSDGLAPRWVAAGPLATSDLGGSDTFRRVAEQLFRQLESTTRPSPRLGSAFYEWDEASLRAITGLRAQTIEVGRQFADRRRRVSPKPKSSTSSY